MYFTTIVSLSPQNHSLRHTYRPRFSQRSRTFTQRFHPLLVSRRYLTRVISLSQKRRRLAVSARVLAGPTVSRVISFLHETSVRKVCQDVREEFLHTRLAHKIMTNIIVGNIFSRERIPFPCWRASDTVGDQVYHASLVLIFFFFSLYVYLGTQ